MSVTSSVCGVRAATGRCWRRRPPAPRRLRRADSGWSAGPRHGAAAATGLSLDRGASRPAAAAPSSPPSARADPAIRRDTALGPGRPRRSDRGSGPGRTQRQAPPADRVRTAFFVAAVALGAAALVHLVRYLLLVINRNTLLNWLVADAAALLSVLASLAAIAAVMTCAVVLTRWLIARRAAAFEHARQAGTPVAPGAVGRHAAAAVGGDGAGHHVRRGRWRPPATRPAGR